MGEKITTMAERFSELLQNKRKEKNMTKKDVAKLIGLTPMYYARYENNQLIPTQRNLPQFAKFLEMNEKVLWKFIMEHELNQK